MSNRSTVVAVALSLCAASSHAAESFTDMFSLSGFGTGGYTYSTEKLADFTGRYVQPTGAGHSDKWGFGVDSRLGLQINAQFTSDFSAVVQGVMERQYDNEFRPNVEWANLKYQITSDWSVRVGRVVAPTNLFSESSKVGLSYLWVRPPVELYRTVVFTNLDGVETSWRTRFGGVTATLQAEYGQTSVTVASSGSEVELDYDSLALLNATFEWDALTVRAGLSRGDYTVNSASIGPLYSAMNAVGLNSIAVALGQNGSLSSTYNMGALYDGDTWVLAGELNYLDTSDSAAADYLQGYVSVGYRVNSFTPYIMAVGTDRRSTPYFSPSLADSTNPMIAAVQSFLIRQANTIVGNAYFEQTSASAGVRWDYKPNIAFKTQVSRVMPGSESIGTLTNLQPGFQKGHDYTVASATIDFVF